MTKKAISRISVHRLFGTYDYALATPGTARDPHRLVILYGDNGSGKTTILRVLFHLLAPEPAEGHKTTVAGIPFLRFEIDFNTRDRVWARRPEGRLTGGFEMGLKLGRRPEVTVDFATNEEGAVKPTAKGNAFLEKLRQLNLGLYFLADDRTVRLAGQERRNLPFIRPNLIDEELFIMADLPSEAVRRRRASDPERRAQQLLVESMKRAEMWIQSQAVRGAAVGESSVNTLYGEILKRILSLPLDKSVDSSDRVAKIEERISQLELRSKQYAQYGLLPEFNGRGILDIVKSAPSTHLAIVTNVVAPYVESVEKRLDAMERLQRQIDALVRLVNSFFTRKRIVFEIHRGFSITTDENKELQPQMLSSGERHLLLLFCNTVIALDRPSIFIIDEPEISLNIKWQRRLLSSLLECAGENPVQYLFATHSFELLAQHKDNAIKLSPSPERKDGRKANS